MLIQNTVHSILKTDLSVSTLLRLDATPYWSDNNDIMKRMPAVTGMTEVFMRPKPFVLIVLDGFGYRADLNGNAIANARTPHWSTLWNMYPHALLSASGTDVGLPAGQMGNSEVGHLNIGAGRIVYQDSLRISDAIQNDTFSQNLVLQKPFKPFTPPTDSIYWAFYPMEVSTAYKHTWKPLFSCVSTHPPPCIFF